MPPTISAEGRLVVLYDGLCGMCDELVQFLLRRDKNDVFRFTPQQSEFAQGIMARHALSAAVSETIWVIEDCNFPTERVFTKSDATLRIAEGLGGLWKVGLVGKLLPRFLRDAGYDFVARNRYRIFGKRTECRLPASDERHKFLF